VVFRLVHTMGFQQPGGHGRTGGPGNGPDMGRTPRKMHGALLIVYKVRILPDSGPNGARAALWPAPTIDVEPGAERTTEGQ